MRKRLVIGSSCWLFGFAWLSIACGGSAPADLFSDPVADAPDSSTRVDGSSPRPSSDSGTGGGNVGPDAQPGPADAQSEVDATIDAPATFDASPADVAVDVAPPPPPTKPKITCGVTSDGYKMACADNQECCSDSRQNPAYTCPPPGQCQATPILCGSAAECGAGQICCATYNVQGAFYERMLCYAGSACPLPAAGFTYPRMCTFNPGECPLGTTCQPSAVLFGYASCQ